jgi:N,N-dimethylformamidase
MACLPPALEGIDRHGAADRVMAAPRRTAPNTLPIIGYADRLAVRPAQTIAFKVSCEAGAESFRADIVRLRCGDDRPDGPGFRETAIEAEVNGEYSGRQQAIDCGSHLVIPCGRALDGLKAFTMACLVWPTLPGSGTQTVMARWQGGIGEGCGYALGLDADGRLVLNLGQDGGRKAARWQLTAARPLQPRRWYRLLASLDPASGAAVLHYEALDRVLGDPGTETRRETAPVAAEMRAGQPFTIGAHLLALAAGVERSAGHFNGKIEAPCLVGAAVDPGDLAKLLADPSAFPIAAAWDLAQGIATSIIRDIGPNRLHGRAVNLPARGVTGHSWAGRSLGWREAPADYAAIHFHQDDLYDCGWKTDLAWKIPADLASGIYAARLRTGATEAEGEEHIPFFVLPPRGGPRAPIAFLAASATYLAYANSHDHYEDPTAEVAHGALPALSPTDLFLMRRRDLGLSTYDVHRDGSGCFYSSRLRPVLNMRPKKVLWGFNADLHIVDWLEQQGLAYDVIDDETLDAEGLSLLQGYRCLVTGTHPEYYSPPMLDALAGYLGAGGRLAYLGGNGFYWKIAWHPELPGVIEVRRGEGGTRTWAGAPGEIYLSALGEPGGLWRALGRAPQKLVGIGYASEGFDSGAPYCRLPASRDPRAAFIFEGVGEGSIGGFGAFGGAAALELDIVDARLGTPAHALRLAASGNHSNIYVLTPEELVTNYPGTDGIESPLVRADMVFFETAAGGAVFATGSIGWAASLAHGGYDNDVARITANVLRRFLEPEPFAPPSPGSSEET